MNSNEIKRSLVDNYIKNYSEEVIDILNTASDEEILSYLKNQSDNLACDILIHLNSDVSAAVILAMEDSYFATLFSTIDPYAGAMLMSRLRTDDANNKFELLPKQIASELRELLTYPSESAGFLMDTRVATFNPVNTVAQVLEKLRTIKDRRLVNIYVVNEEDRLLGRVPIQIIAISPPQESLINLMEACVSVHVMSPRSEIVSILKESKLMNLPVVDLDHRLLGIIRYDNLVEVAKQDISEDVLAIFGAGREERALSKVGFAVKKRLPWLEINLATAFLAASVVGIFEETIAQITVLAVFLPVVAGQAGNTGSQALAVTIRGLALREIRVSQWFKVARKETAVGFLNGVAVSLTTSIIVYFWAKSLGLAIVIGVSMVFSMVIAGLSGAVIPIFLKSIGQDPAQSSSIVLTTVTDIVGFMSFLGLATLLSSMIGG